MELIIRGSFFRDWDNASSRELNKVIRAKKDEIKKAKAAVDITFLKKLRKRTNFYKIELRINRRKIYWILCAIPKAENKIEFVRLKPESFFKKNL